ncbi:SusE domain-containing protein [Desertivirga xinjiangensis]|uniref:SusE domain-containing protein n=1 Tax=Desertivirga xinjiangensis TaxID=539206 RepID=UPI00210AA7D5|nr:SusE domain-containing protein [Pedobacter xinjiangensis]
MEKVKYLYKIVPLFFAVLCMTACEPEVLDIPKVEERLELKASAENITLDEEHLEDNAITFSWTEAREVSDDHLVSYTTKMDVVGNNFGSATAIMNYEDEGINSRSFTSEQLQNWANEKWGVAANKPFTIEFRIIAEWEGGATFEAPEVRTVRVNVQPIRTVVFNADKVFLDGSAVPGLSKVEMSKTLENPNQYAFLLDLEAGDLQIPVEFEGATNYIYSADANDQLQDGETIGIKMRETPFAWKIETPGQYRVVVNMQKATAAIYSPATALTPKSVVWNGGGGAITTEVTDLWMHGAINNWGAPIKMSCTPSLADPQVLVYTGGRTGKAKFIVYGGNDNDKNLAYAFSSPLTAAGLRQDITLTLGKVNDLGGGFSGENRNSYITIPTGTNFLVFDLRNMTILAEKR